LKFTLRELLGLAAFIAISLASMRIGGVLAGVTIFATAVFATAVLIVALVAHNVRRSLAIGFLVPFLAYAVVHAASSRDELDPYGDFALPTTRSFQPLFRAFVTTTWIDFHTGKELPDYDPTADPSRHSGGGGIMSPAGMVTMRETPNRATFTLLAHSLVAVLLGIAGAKFGAYIHKTENS
jgi:hypothetical protein